MPRLCHPISNLQLIIPEGTKTIETDCDMVPSLLSVILSSYSFNVWANKMEKRNFFLIMLLSFLVLQANFISNSHPSSIFLDALAKCMPYPY